jgi:hypothetical protein
MPPVYIPITGRRDIIEFVTSGIDSTLLLDFGALCLNESKDTSFTLISRSTIETPLTADYPGDKFILTAGNPFLKSFRTDEDRAIDIRFAGSGTEGLFLDTLLLTDTCGVIKQIILKAALTTPEFALEKKTLDFGECTLWCDTLKRDTLRIKNISKWGIDANIAKIEISGMFANPETATINVIEGDLLPNGEEKAYEIVFTPKKSGFYEDSLKIIMNPCGVVETIYLKGSAVETGFTALRDGIDFGMLRLNSAKDTIVAFQNTGTAIITVNNIAGITPPFELLQSAPPTPAVLQPGDSLKLTVKVNILDTVEYTIDIIPSGIPCGFSAKTLIKAKGLPIIADALIYIPNMHGAAGEKINIPLILESSKNLAQSGADAFEAKIRMNRTLLKPLNIDAADVSISGDKRDIIIKGKWDRPDGVLFNMEFLPALGDSVCTALEIAGFKWLNGLSNVELIDGRFCLIDVCYEGGARLFDDDYKISLSQSRPNPAAYEAELDFELIEDAPSSLILTDITGRELKTLFATSKAGKYNVKFDASELENGVYIIILKTPSHNLSRIMCVLK